jgi:hypothetical protein
VLVVVIGSSAPLPARAASIDIAPSRDTTLYEDGAGALANGAGVYLFSGQGSGLRRALLAFDIAGSIPAGATILAAHLSLHCSRRPFGAPPPVDLELHRVLADWGEAASDAGEPGGTGTVAEPGDATWIHRFSPASLWTSPGGDFDPAVSGGFACGDLGTYTVASTTTLVADVQSWVDDPASSYGWILIGPPSDTTNARRFDSRESPDAGVRPVLHVDYDLPAVPVGSTTWGALKSLFQ